MVIIKIDGKIPEDELNRIENIKLTYNYGGDEHGITVDKRGFNISNLLEPLVMQVVCESWYEIMARNMDIEIGVIKRFATKELAEKYLCRDNYLQPEKFEVVRVSRQSA